MPPMLSAAQTLLFFLASCPGCCVLLAAAPAPGGFVANLEDDSSALVQVSAAVARAGVSTSDAGADDEQDRGAPAARIESPGEGATTLGERRGLAIDAIEKARSDVPGTISLPHEEGKVPAVLGGVGLKPCIGADMVREGSGRAIGAGSSVSAKTVVPAPLIIEGLLQGIICIFWICLISCIPLVFAMMEDRIQTAHMLQCAVLFATVSCGIILYTCVLHFNSSRWDGARHLTITEAVYFMSAVLTTVGYGDITPAFSPGQLVVAFYALFAIVVFADIIVRVGQVVFRQVERRASVQRMLAAKKDMKSLEKRSSVAMWYQDSSADTTELPGGLKKAVCRTITERAMQEPVPYTALARAGLLYLGLTLGGAAFFTFYPGENISFGEGVYMGIVTLTSTGLGDYTAKSEGGRVFSAFWMVFGVAALINATAALSEVLMSVRKQRRGESDEIKKQEFEEASRCLRLDDEGRLDKVEFMRFALLHAKIATEDDLQRIEHTFSLITRGNPAGKVRLETLARTELGAAYKPPSTAPRFPSPRLPERRPSEPSKLDEEVDEVPPASTPATATAAPLPAAAVAAPRRVASAFSFAAPRTPRHDEEDEDFHYHESESPSVVASTLECDSESCFAPGNYDSVAGFGRIAPPEAPAEPAHVAT